MWSAKHEDLSNIWGNSLCDSSRNKFYKQNAETTKFKTEDQPRRLKWKEAKVSNFVHQNNISNTKNNKGLIARVSI